MTTESARSKRRRTLLFISIFSPSLLIVVTFLGIFLIPESPKTPMTLDRAEQLFKEVSTPGLGREDLQAWLSSKGIDGLILQRRNDGARAEPWLDGVGQQTVAECAGLKTDDVGSAVRVDYLEARRFPLGHGEIAVYFFFDKSNRLLRQWANEHYIGL